MSEYETQEYEVGITYKKGSRYYVAISETEFFTINDGDCQLVEAQSDENYKAKRRMTVESLCAIWSISLKDLDEISAEFFTPTLCKDSTPSYRSAQKQEKFREHCRRGRVRLVI